jgi:ubiquinone/menaquinone biosynthesis C-methylase UbiE
MDYKHVIWEGYHYRFGLAGEGQADIIERYLATKKGRVLNIGCGPGGDKIKNLAGHCKSLICSDISAAAINFARAAETHRRVSYLVTDTRNLPIAKNTVDHILALGLFAYITDVGSVFREFYRVCRGAGYLMVTNSVAHPKEQYIEESSIVGFRLIEKQEGYCPAASGDVKRRYLLVFQRH